MNKIHRPGHGMAQGQAVSNPDDLTDLTTVASEVIEVRDAPSVAPTPPLSQSEIHPRAKLRTVGSV